MDDSRRASAPVASRSRTRPALSLEAGSLFGSQTDDAARYVRQPLPSARERYQQRRLQSAAPISPLASKGGRPVTAISGFTKVRDSLNRHQTPRPDHAISSDGLSEPSMPTQRAGIPTPSSISNGLERQRPQSALSKVHDTLTDVSINDAGPLVQLSCAGGARLTLTLDRQIHYRAAPAMTAGWTYHDFVTHNPDPLKAISMQHITSKRDRSSMPPSITYASTKILSVPRMLLCCTLDLEPYVHPNSSLSSENFEFVSVQIDFWTASAIAKPNHDRHVDTPISTVFSGFSEHSGSRASSVGRTSIRGSDLPVVRGFFPGEVTESGFLQSFGPILYQSMHGKSEDAVPVVLGSGHEKTDYKAFETRLSTPGKPVLIDGDKFTGRGCQDSATALQTPASSTFVPGSGRSYASTPISSIGDSSAFGTSSIRIMVKRDSSHDGSWARRKFPFLVLLEHPADAASIEARIKLDRTTIKRSVPPGLARMNSLSRAPSTRTRTGMPSAPTVSSRRAIGHAASRSMSAAGPGSSVGSRDVDEDIERLVKIYPRQDPISVISCGAGTVKDTLYKSGTVSRPAAQRQSIQAPSAPAAAPAPMSTTVAEPRLSSVPQGRVVMQPEARALSQSASLRSRQSTQSSASSKHSRAASAQFTPGMYMRSGSFGSVSSRASTPSLTSNSDSEGSVYSQPSAPRSVNSHRKTMHGYSRSLAGPVAVHEEEESREIEDVDKYEPVAKQGLRPRLDTMMAPEAEDEMTEEMFDMVLTTWTNQKMDRHPSPTVAVGSIPYVSNARHDTSVIPFLGKH